MIVPTKLKGNCDASKALLDWIWWTQTNQDAIEMADKCAFFTAINCSPSI